MHDCNLRLALKTHLDEVASAGVKLINFLVTTSSHDYILLIFVRVEFCHEEHLALPKRSDGLPSLSVPDFDDFVITAGQELPAIIAEADVFDTLHATTHTVGPLHG